MQYLILSDLHLRQRFEKGKMKYIMDLVNRFENVILNGDFYEAKYYDANKFLNSQYKPLIELLRSKHTTYLFGNHDPKSYASKVAHFISNGMEADSLKIGLNSKKYHIEHGNRLSHPNETEDTPVWLIKLIDKVSYFLERYWPGLALWEGTKWNKNVLKNRYSDGKISPEEILICGHTHAKVFDLDAKYIDSGYTKYGQGNYVLIDDNGVSLVPFSYDEN